MEIVLYDVYEDIHKARSLLAHFVLNHVCYKAELCTRCVVFYNNCTVQALSHSPLRPLNLCFIKMVFRVFF